MTKETDAIWQQRIAKQLDGLQYGQVIVTVHDGQIVQIDRMERTRYPLTSNHAAGKQEAAEQKKLKSI